MAAWLLLVACSCPMAQEGAAATEGALAEGAGQPAASSSDTALAKRASSRVSLTRVPPGTRVKWFQRKETVWIEVEATGLEGAAIDLTDEGMLTLVAKDPRQNMTLQLNGRINTSRSRWWKSGRTMKFELCKANYGDGHWDRLCVGEKHPNILIDWTSWIDEEEENEILSAPYGHDTHHMVGAMGGSWGSNVDRSIKAKEQAARVDTYDPDEPEEEITMG